MRQIRPRPPLPLWQTVTAYTVLIAIPFLCIGLCFLRLSSSQSISSIGIIVSVALTVIIWMFRKLPAEQVAGHQKKITKAQRITAGKALFRICSIACLLLLNVVSMICLLFHKASHRSYLEHMGYLLVLMLNIPLWFSGMVQNYLLYKKARREGPLVIMPSSLPPTELANLRNSWSVANLEHAVPESFLAKADTQSAEVAVNIEHTTPSSALPRLEEAAQQVARQR